MLKEYTEADLDGDGEVTLEELKSQPEVAERMALPKPVKPVRAGIKNSPEQMQNVGANQQQQQQQAWLAQQQQQAWLAQQQQQAWLAQQQQQQQQQQQGWGQPVQPMQPTIRSEFTAEAVELELTQIGASVLFVEHKTVD